MNRLIDNQQMHCDALEKDVNAAYAYLDKNNISKLLFEKDPSLWKKDLEQTKEIANRLGWLDLPDQFTKNLNVLISFANSIREEGYKHIVLLGMGGSSLCSEVARNTFGTVKDYPELRVLDNTDPFAITALEKQINISETLFIVASKSGNTEETICFFRYFYHQLEIKGDKNPGNNFVAITDPDTPLIKLADNYHFRKVFLNPSDLGGRYSVLSDFGLLPMVLTGVDIHALLISAEQMETVCKNSLTKNNSGLSLGAVLGVAHRHGRDKVTFALSSSISSLGLWLEQLLAESTGKEGKGLIPINGERLSSPEVYGQDRIFIHIYLASDNNVEDEKKLRLLEKEGHPVIRICMVDKIALGAEYYRWEIATAVAGMLIGINPFDQPNVEESKINTNRILESWCKNRHFEKSEPVLSSAGISIYAGKKTLPLTFGHPESPGDFVNRFTAQAKPNEYIALLPYFLMTDFRTTVLQKCRHQLRADLKTATTLLNGPRYLHSTGQLHKGGPDSGLYIILTVDEGEDLIIPGKQFGFSALHQAQAAGDFRSLDDKGRKVIRIHLGKDVDAGLNKLYEFVIGQVADR